MKYKFERGSALTIHHPCTPWAVQGINLSFASYRYKSVQSNKRGFVLLVSLTPHLAEAAMPSAST